MGQTGKGKRVLGQDHEKRGCIWEFITELRFFPHHIQHGAMAFLSGTGKTGSFGRFIIRKTDGMELSI